MGARTTDRKGSLADGADPVRAGVSTGRDAGDGIIRFPGGAMRVAAAWLGQASPAWLDPRAMLAQPVTQGGRQAAWFVQGPFGDAVLRHYRRGGLRARLGRESYLWLGRKRTRSFAEFEVLAHLCRAGLRVPAPIAAAYWRRGPWYRAALMTRRIPGVRTLAQALVTAAGAGVEVEAGVGAMGGAGAFPPVPGADPVAVAAAVRAMHDAGVWHADLNAHNILLDASGAVWLIDFDRARLGVVPPAQRRKNLLRLRRSLVKVAGAPGALWWDELHSAYERQAC